MEEQWLLEGVDGGDGGLEEVMSLLSMEEAGSLVGDDVLSSMEVSAWVTVKLQFMNCYNRINNFSIIA